MKRQIVLFWIFISVLCVIFKSGVACEGRNEHFVVVNVHNAEKKPQEHLIYVKCEPLGSCFFYVHDAVMEYLEVDWSTTRKDQLKGGKFILIDEQKKIYELHRAGNNLNRVKVDGIRGTFELAYVTFDTHQNIKNIWYVSDKITEGVGRGVKKSTK